MRKYLAIGLVCLSMAAVSCRRDKLNPEYLPQAQDVSFSVEMNIFRSGSKATDAAFDNGDLLGIFAGAPIGKTNVKGTVSGTTLTPSSPIQWQAGQTEETTFAAYYPYNATATGQSFSFAVQTDQTTYAAYLASDLRGAVTKAAAGTPVTFSLQHLLSKLVVVPTCEDASETVTSVTVREPVTRATADLSAATVSVGTEKADVKMGAAASGNGGKGFVSILIPQAVQLQLAVTTSKGRTLPFTLTEPATLASGTAYLAEITVAKEAPGPGPEPAEFTISIIDWGSPEDLTFLADDAYDAFSEGKWSVIGTVNGTNWDSDIWMTETAAGVWEADITYPAGGAFKLRKDGKWSTETETHSEAGQPGDATGPVPGDGTEYNLWATDNIDITLPSDGEYHLKFVEEGYLFYATLTSEPAPSISELYLLGEATDAGWSLDDMPALTKSGNTFSITANLKANAKFRFPLQKAPNTWWPCLVRGDAEGTVKIGTGDGNDADQFTVAEDGSYEIVIDVAAMTIAMTRVGDRVEQQVTITELYLLGGATDTGWDLDKMPALEKSGNVFTITAHLKAGTLEGNEVFRFPMQKAANKWWPCLVKGSSEGKVMVGTSDGDQSRQFTVDTSGTYLITIDTAAMTISIVLQTPDA